MDDYIGGGALGYVRDPSWTMVYLGGLKKAIPIIPEKQIWGEIIFEISCFDQSLGSENHSITKYTYYRHGNVKQGYTNKGQWLGNAGNPGGNGQYLGFVLYYPKGKSSIAVSRNNPDSDFMYHFEPGTRSNKANLLLDLQTSYFLKSMQISGGFTYDLIIGDYYVRSNTITHNFSLQLSAKFLL
jgi:hypothetical protein